MRLKAPRKMRNVPSVVDGYKFASKKEAKRYGELKLLLKAGAIWNLKVHPRFAIMCVGHHICDYVADFAYDDTLDGAVEDVKGRQSGPAWQMFRLKAKLMLALYGIEVKVI
jgi:hypothetical protein